MLIERYVPAVFLLSTTWATDATPKTIRVNVPRNSAISSRERLRDIRTVPPTWGGNLRCRVLSRCGVECSQKSCSEASLQGARRLRCRVLEGFAAACSETSLQGARRLRCTVLHGFAAWCFTASLHGASRLRCMVLHGFAAWGFTASLHGASRLWLHSAA